MDENFWLRRWETGDIGFHKEKSHQGMAQRGVTRLTEFAVLLKRV